MSHLDQIPDFGKNKMQIEATPSTRPQNYDRKLCNLRKTQSTVIFPKRMPKVYSWPNFFSSYSLVLIK